MAKVVQWISDHLTALVALAVFVSSRLNSKKLQKMHIDINGRFTELLRTTAIAQHARGVVEGREQSLIENQARTTEAERIEDRAKGPK